MPMLASAATDGLVGSNLPITHVHQTKVKAESHTAHTHTEPLLLQTTHVAAKSLIMRTYTGMGTGMVRE